MVRQALDAEEQRIRVSDHLTRETFDVTLSRSAPYASPLISPYRPDESKSMQSQGHDWHAGTITPPPSRRRRPRWMRYNDEDVETPPDVPSRGGIGAFVWYPDARSPIPSRHGSPVAATAPHESAPISSSPVTSMSSPALTPSSPPSTALRTPGTTHVASVPPTSPPASPPSMPSSPPPPISSAYGSLAPTRASSIASRSSRAEAGTDASFLTSSSAMYYDAPSTLSHDRTEPPLMDVHAMLGTDAMPSTSSAPAEQVVPAIKESPRPPASVQGVRTDREQEAIAARQALAQRRSSHSMSAISTAMVPQRMNTSSTISATERTFDQEMAENADALRRSWRAKNQGSTANDQTGHVVPAGLKGNLIGEDHVNYVLMYHMLTGIRIAVSRCEARPPAPLTSADFGAKYKFTFDIIGNELASKSTYDFKFKDYAPSVFRDLRRHFGLDAGDYLLSLAAKYILTELGSPGKSGSFFYFSHDYRFIIKTIRHGEHKLFLKILQPYYEHVQANPQTLLSQFYGLHRVKLPGRKKIHFVIMNNLFPPHRDVHELYDLKGSYVSREQTSSNPHAVLKDTNWTKRGRVIELGPEKHALFEKQLRADVALLQRLRLMDYSLLIGLHDVAAGAGLQRTSTLRGGGVQPMLRKPSIVVSPVDDPRDTSVQSPVLRGGERDAHMLFARDAANLTDTPETQNKRHAERQRQVVFYQDEGGFRATDAQNHPLPVIYYLGIIDIFTQYDAVKRAEHAWKSIWYDRRGISPVPPRQYGERFIRFLVRQKHP